MVPTGVRPGLCRRPRWAATSNSSSESARGPPNDQGTLVSLAPHRLPADDLCAPGQAPASRAGSADVNKKDGSSHGACSLWARLTLLLHEVHTPLAVTQAPPTPPILQRKQLRLRKEPASGCTAALRATTVLHSSSCPHHHHPGALPSSQERSPLPGELRTHPCPRAPHLQDFALGALRKQQHLVIQRVQ